MVVHPSLDQPTDEVRVDAKGVGRVVGLSGSNPLQEYIDRACSTVWSLEPITGREAGLSR